MNTNAQVAQFSESLIRLVLNKPRGSEEGGVKPQTDTVTLRLPAEMVMMLNTASEATGEARVNLVQECIRRSLGPVVAEIFDKREQARKDWEKSQRISDQHPARTQTPTLKKAHQKN